MASYAQFVTSKTVFVEEVHRGPDLHSRKRHPEPDYFTDLNASKYGGLIEILPQPGARSRGRPPAPTCSRLPQKLAQLWWKNVAQAVTGEKTPQKAMDTLAEEMDQVMGRLERAGMANCPPKLQPEGKHPSKWLSDKGAPWKKLANEKPKRRDHRLRQACSTAWKAGKVR